MHPQDSIFTGVKIIDYRNSRYQGLFNSQTQRRQGMGILVDDNMNIYCSEWEDNRMNGSTFIYFANGNYIYGLWRNNQPHGVNVYRNKEFILIGVYIRGANFGNTLAITDAINHMLVFDGQQIALREERRKDLELISSENILEINFFQDIIYHTAGKNAIQLSKKQVSLINFLGSFADKYRQLIKFDNKNNNYYFGFLNGLGFRFNLHGKVNHRINLISIGSHIEGEKISDFGKKYHQSRCIEQGNFTLKQTITYNKPLQRPREKCIAIYQKNHKKALNFINQYYQYKENLISNIELFLLNHLYPKHQENLKQEYEMRRVSKPELHPIRQDDIQSRLTMLKKMSAKNEKKREDQESKNLNKYGQNGSTSALYKKQSTNNLNSNNNKHKYHRHNQNRQYNQYQEIQGQLNHIFKKEIICERCKSKEIKRSRDKKINSNSNNKLTPQKIKSKSKSGNKNGKNGNKKQLKYLANYKPTENLKQKMLAEKERNRSRSFTNIMKKQSKEIEKQRLRIQNQIKIREQLFSQQIYRQTRDYNIARQHPLTFSELLPIQPTHLSPIGSFSPSSREIRLNHQNSSGRHHHDQNIDNNKKIELLQSRRNKILREFKQLNISVPVQRPQKKIYQQPFKRIDEIKISPFNEVPKFKEGLDERERILQFNKRYRNYLQSDKNSIQNELYYRMDMQESFRQPYVPSFTHTPLRNDYQLIQQPARKSKEKKYQYFFDSPAYSK